MSPGEKIGKLYYAYRTFIEHRETSRIQSEAEVKEISSDQIIDP